MGKCRDEYRARFMRLDEYRTRQSLVGLSAHCKFLHPSHMYIPWDVRILLMYVLSETRLYLCTTTVLVGLCTYAHTYVRCTQGQNE